MDSSEPTVYIAVSKQGAFEGRGLAHLANTFSAAYDAAREHAAKTGLTVLIGRAVWLLQEPPDAK